MPLGRAVTETGKKSPSPAYWTISTGLLLWALAYAGLVLFTFVLATPDDLQTLAAAGRIKPEYVAYIGGIPSWAIMATAVVAITRLLGGIGLLLRRAWALTLYAISLVLFLLIFIRAFFFAGITDVIRGSQVAVELLFVFLSVFAVWFAKKMRSDGLIKGSQ